MSECIFCGIVAATIPARVIRETDDVICFLPKRLGVYGHTLIVPKKHYEDLFDIPPTLLCTLAETAQHLAMSYRGSISCTGVNLMHASGTTAQQSVPHFHFHLLPRFPADGLDTWPDLPEVTADADEVWQRLRGYMSGPDGCGPV